MRQVFGAFVALAIGWGLCAPSHAQELFPLQAIAGGGGGSGPCTSNDSSYVPAGYKCVSHDEFNGSSVDTSKWAINSTDCSGTPGISEGSGVLLMQAQPACGGTSNGVNGSTAGGMRSKFPIPDAPMYLEFGRTLTPGTVSLMQFWKSTCIDNAGGSNGFVASCTGEETDIDMGQFNGCNQNNQGSGASATGLCSGMFNWNNGGNQGFFNGGTAGSVSVDSDQQPHVIGLQILPDPAPNGTVNYLVDGVVVKSLTNMPDDRWIHASHWLSPGGSQWDTFDLDLFCSNGNGCNFGMSIAWDYFRIYTPSGLPNGY